MRYYSNSSLIIRSMIEGDIEKIIDGFLEQHSYKPDEIIEGYYVDQTNNTRSVIVAELTNTVAGYATLLPFAKEGPFTNRNIPEIVDFNVFSKYRNSGIGSRIMDVTENLAKMKCDFVSLSVGLHSGYGSAQRMYVKRGYIPDGTGVWYNGKQLDQYADCKNDDDLVLYFLKAFE